jgi:hypothetical protein
MARATNFLYAMLIATAIVAVMFTFMSYGVTTYDVTMPDKYNSTLQTMKNLTAVSSSVEDIKTKALNENSEQKSFVEQVYDKIGEWFERGLNTVKLIPNMLNMFDEMANSGLESTSNIFGIAAGPFKVLVIALMTVFVIVGVFLSAVINREL